MTREIDGYDLKDNKFESTLSLLEIVHGCFVVKVF